MMETKSFSARVFQCGMKTQWFTMIIYFLLFCLMIQCMQCKKSPKCSTCKEIVDNFNSNLAATEKSNYGGGNTKWEEKSLGSYAFSEVRLVEIMETLCAGKSTECHTVLEEHEDVIEHFWFKEFAQQKDTDFHTFLCIDQMKACCPSNHFGRDCTPCPGGTTRPCGGNGKCVGEGTRDGSGKCKCSSGYKGDLCNECNDGFYEHIKNDTYTECKVCHLSCKKLCWEGGQKGCDECKDGWLQSEEDGCQDINECTDDPCDEHQYCTNTQGSYSCFSCDIACLSCTGAGPNRCNGCKEGFLKLDNGTCHDIDECSLDPNLCNKENEECLNLPGSYECACKSGFEYTDEQCVALPLDYKKTIKSEQLKMSKDIKRQLEENKSVSIDWSKFKDTPSVVTHFVIVGIYGLTCWLTSSSHLAVFALSVLMVVHVTWFAINSR